jgi:HK97 family phage major capsid protein
MSIEIIKPKVAKPDARGKAAPLQRAATKILSNLYFDSFAQQVAAISRAAAGGGIDPRLKRAPLVRAPSGLTTMDPTLGGFLVAPEFAPAITQSVYDQATLASRCDRRVTKNLLAGIKIPGLDETSRQEGSRYAGTTVYWPAQEGTTVSSTFPKWRALELAGHKIMAIVMATNELMADAPLFGSYIMDVLPKALAWELDLQILTGTGAGVPLGVLNSPATIVVPKVTGQTTKTVMNDNILQMWQRLPGPSRTRAVWLVNEDMDQQLDLLGANTNPNTYVPAGMYGNKYPLLKGAPVICTEQSPQLGNLGDIVLADLGWYIVADGGQRSMLSLDVEFNNDQAVLRFVWHVDGRASVTTPITPYNGSSTRSPFIALAAR